MGALSPAAAQTEEAPSAAPVRALPSPHRPQLNCVSAILVDAASGQVLYELNADTRRPMASTTKIMTALLFTEAMPDTGVVVASERACQVRDSSLHLKPGEKVSAHDMLRAILMRSANDGCVAAAEAVAGSEQAFVDRMNARAAQLGAVNTHYANPHGLHDPDHYTTARDLATIARAAMQVPRIEEVVRCQRCRITRSIDKKDVTMRNHSHFLGYFPGADGVKTGYTVPAGHCYVGSATVGGWRLISVVLKSQRYVVDTAELMKYGFGNFKPNIAYHRGDIVAQCPVQGGVAPTVPVSVLQPLQFISLKTDQPAIVTEPHFSPVSAPVAPGATVGAIELKVNGATVQTAPLVTMAAVNAAPTARAVKHDNPWKRFALTTTIFAVGLVSLRYGTRYGFRAAALAKGARRRRRRFAQKLRSNDRGRTRLR